MSIGSLERERVTTGSGFHWQDEDEFILPEESWEEQTPTVPSENIVIRKLAEDWKYGDPVKELLQVLVHLGRSTEVELIQRILYADPKDEDFMIRAMVSAKWADDWDSPEDSVYDEL